MATDERLRELEEKYEGYKVYDNAGEKIGKVDDLFVDEQDQEEYIGVKMGLFGMKSTLIPMEVARINENDRAIEVAESKDHVKNAPNFDDDEDITPEFEERIRRHFGLTGQEGSSDRGSYGGRSSASGSAGAAATGEDTTRGAEAGTTNIADTDDHRELDREGTPEGTGGGGSGESVGREEYRNREDFSGSGSTGTAASGSPSDLETGDRGSTGDQGSTEDPYREGYLEGLREAGREAGRREARGSGDQGETMDRSGSSGQAEGAEGGGRQGEGERSEGGATRVWRRIRN